METQMWEGILGFRTYFDIPQSYDCGAASSTQINPKELSWYSFLLKAELLSVDTRTKSLENFQEPLRDWNSKPLFL